ncbi:DinB superfamily protein [Psychrobacillus sp. OK028]|uniref:DinB family protein n=1 Tax=Psychrobacillus sp. OK028 TaxID=1884359 RepID=UPI0008923DBC|nr:DinB family protein [Psychrobacillus sp. OK028]SDN11525.1 DinB superfamily protein [Psychrobacillus sp. OK028]
MFIEKNNEIRKNLFQQIDSLTNEQFNTKSDEASWSPKEIIDHLVKMEYTIIKGIKKELANLASPSAKKKPIGLSTLRLVKVDAPAQTVPSSEYKRTEEMKAQLHHARMELLTLYKSTDPKILKEKSMKHPIFGQVPLIQWFAFTGLHEKRHAKQLEKTIKKIKGH